MKKKLGCELLIDQESKIKFKWYLIFKSKNGEKLFKIVSSVVSF